MIPAGPAHAALLAAIHAASFPEGGRWAAAAMATQLGLPGTFGLIDPDGAFILARVAAGEAEILTLATMPALRRAGRARRLLAAAMRHAAQAGAEALFLEVSVANLPAQALYRGAGFREVGRRPRYYEDGTDALVLRVGLTPS